MNKFINVFTDGGARGNPGPAAIGVYIEDENKNKLAEIGKTIGNNTNNVAEYSAVLEGFLWIAKNKEKINDISEIKFYMDSLLVCSQLNGLYKIKNSNLRELLFKIRELESEIKIPVSYSHVRREKNKLADSLVNKALDTGL